MTGVSPLQSFHKKGLFGYHHKKNQNNLLQVSEIKDLSIIQVVQYKRSKIEINDITVDNVKFPHNISGIVNSNEKTRILWMGPRMWFVVSNKESIYELINEKCDVDNFAVTDLSHSRAIIQIRGLEAKEILKKGSPINFYELKKNNCVSTVFHGINILIDMLEDKPETFNLFALRSFGESFYHDITDAALEDGYIAI